MRGSALLADQSQRTIAPLVNHFDKLPLNLYPSCKHGPRIRSHSRRSSPTRPKQGENCTTCPNSQCRFSRSV
ncbi:hypothetical protein EYC80_009549 [Monilinia laxa]|uniref:Uncharacterized protein n=1 Tax=Monilinia laxa TaxID=61186 RepID=A0A5N6JY79_MONLA|nr:hypothetical protein EYC80_009549 [Monilinia laxa]